MVCVLYIYISLKTEVEKMWVYLHSEALSSFPLLFKKGFHLTSPYLVGGVVLPGALASVYVCPGTESHPTQSAGLALAEGLTAWGVEDRVINSPPTMKLGSISTQIFVPLGSYWQYRCVTSQVEHLFHSEDNTTSGMSFASYSFNAKWNCHMPVNPFLWF